MNETMNWIKENLALVVAIASVVGAIGAAYPLLKDLVPWLLRTIWDIIRAILTFVWWLITPVRWVFGRLIELLIDKLAREEERTP